MGASSSNVSNAQIADSLIVTQTLQDAPGAGDGTVTSLALNPAPVQLSPTTTPPVTKYSADAVTLDGGGAATIDLTDLPGLQAAIDGTGLKVQLMRIQGATGNGALTISPGASNGYELFGAGNDIEYPAGCTRPFKFEFDDKLVDIDSGSGAGEYTIDLAGTVGDVFNIEFLLG